MFQIGQQVTTEWGGGTVIGGVRGTTIKLDSGEVINIAHGTPGARRLREANADVKAGDFAFTTKSGIVLRVGPLGSTEVHN